MSKKELTVYNKKDIDILEDALEEVEKIEKSEKAVKKQKELTSKKKDISKKEKDEPKAHGAAFSAIIAFVDDLMTIFGSKNATPLSLYKRLIGHIEPSDTIAIDKSINGFLSFFEQNGKYIFSGEMQNLPMGAKIDYGDGKLAYIQIQMFIHKSQPEIKESIRQHLMTIAALIQPEKIEEIEKAAESNIPPPFVVDLTTNEGKFIDGIMKKANDAMQNVDASNPMQAVMSLMQSGIMGDMINGMHNGVGSGEMDIVKMMGMMQGYMGAMMQPESTPKK